MDIPDDLKIPDEILINLEKPDTLKSYIDEGKSLQEIIGYSDALMQELYTSAYTLFQEGRYEDAQDAFLFLTTLNPYVYAYWLALAMSYQLVEEYEQAILAYECASHIEPESPLPYYYISGCHLYLGDYDDAENAVKILQEKCKNTKEYPELVEKAENIFATIRKRKK